MSLSPWFRSVSQKYSKSTRKVHRIDDRRKRNAAPKMYLEPLEERMVLSTGLPTLPSPTAVTLATTAVNLKDTAFLNTLTGPGSGALTFTLHYPAAGPIVYTETVLTTGNGTYTTPSGFNLPTAGTVAGTYQWDASYTGTGTATSSNNATNEQVLVTAASPTVVSTPNPTAATINSGANLKDSAVLSGGYHPTGALEFDLYDPVFNVIDVETVTVTGNGTYTTPSGYTLPSGASAAGTYQWNAVYFGDGNNHSANDNSTGEQVVVSGGAPSLTTTPNFTSATLGSSIPSLQDTAVLSNVTGGSASGTITFTLYAPNGCTPVDVETVSASGNGSYTTPSGYALPTSGSVAGTYQWDAYYSGTGGSAVDNNASCEQVSIYRASPGLYTTPSQTSLALGTSAPTLTDTAVLTGGYYETGTITFTLTKSGSSTVLDSESVSVTGGGSYTTPSGYTLPTCGTAVGLYQWNAAYSGDANNNSICETGNSSEQVCVTPASPAITTTPNPSSFSLGTAATNLKDTATLSCGYYETGTITFTLYNVSTSTLVDTETVSVHGNGSYTTPSGYTVPTSGSAAGAYQWDASYSGDANNHTAADINNPNERVTVLTVPTLTSPTFTSVTTNSAVLGGNLTSNGGGVISKRGVLYMVTKPNTIPVLGGPGVFEVDDGSTSTGVFSDLASPLTQTTSYTFVAFATNGAGTGYSPTGLFSSVPSTFVNGSSTGTPNQPQTFSLYAEDSNPKYQNGKFTFHINWGDKANNPTGYTSVVTALNGATTTHTYKAAGTYTIQITATDSSPAGAVLPIGTFTVTISSAPPGVLPHVSPSGPSTGGTTSNVAVINGVGPAALLVGTGNGSSRAGAGVVSVFGGSADSGLLGALTTPSFYNEGTGALNTTALNGILAGWSSSDTLAQRVAALASGSGLNGRAVPNASTLSDNRAVDSLFEATNGKFDLRL